MRNIPVSMSPIILCAAEGGRGYKIFVDTAQSQDAINLNRMKNRQRVLRNAYLEGERREPKYGKSKYATKQRSNSNLPTKKGVTCTVDAVGIVPP